MIRRIQQLFCDKLVLLLFIVFFLRLLFIAVSDIGLVGDESYYWDWSRHPDWCYYSKPPMVAWIIGASTWVFGDNAIAVRFPAVLLGTLLLFVVFQTAKAFFSERAAALAVMMLLVTPLNAVSNHIMTIDPPLYFFWVVSLYYLYQALFRNRTGAWLLAGIATACAFLSKLSALFLPLMLALFLILTPGRRTQLIKEYWLYLLPVGLSFVPLILWNQQHDWIMLGHSQGHFDAKNREFIDVLAEFGVFLLIQIALLSPVIFVLTLKVCVNGLSGLARLSEQERFLLFMGPLLLIGIIGLSLMQKVQGNWSGPFYFATLILLSGWLSAGRWEKWLKPALATGFIIVVLAYSLPMTVKLLGIEKTKIDPGRKLKDWRTLAENFDRIRRQKLDNPEQAFILVHSHRYLVSELAFYLPDQSQVYHLNEADVINNQYDLWPGPEQFIGGEGLVISRHQPDIIPHYLRRAFVDFRRIGTIKLKNDKNKQYFIYSGHQLKHWPLAYVK